MAEKNIITSPNWESKYADRAKGMKSSPIRALFKYLGDPNIISFAGGLPAPQTFPYDLIREKSDAIFSDTKRRVEALQYGQTAGYKPLRQLLAEKVNKYGVPADAENVLLTCGSQQALDLIGKIFVDENTIIFVESPSYLGALQAFASYKGKFVVVPTDNDGMIVERLPAMIEKYHPKFIYTVSTFHNPAGVCMSFERRQKLVEILERYDLFCVEDDPYGELRYEGEHIMPIISLAKERVFYLCTFSKTLAPGLRTGYVIAPAHTVQQLEEAKPLEADTVIPKLNQGKEGADLYSSYLLQMIIADILDSGFFPEHIKKIRALYGERRNAMLEALVKEMPAGVTWTKPQGGLFLWLTTPDKIIVPEFFHTAIDEHVAFVPGDAFYPYPEKVKESQHTMRLNFSAEPPEKIAEGIKRLGTALKKELAK